MESRRKSTELPREHAAVRRLYEFISEMNRWERTISKEFAAMKRDKRIAALPEDQIQKELDRHNQAMRERMGDIFEQYCEVGRNARRMSDVLHYGEPDPDYNPEKEQLRSVQQRGDAVIIETESPQGRFRYETVNVAGKWLIRDTRKGRSPYDKRWHAWNL